MTMQATTYKMDWKTGQMVPIEKMELQRGQALTIISGPGCPSVGWIERIEKDGRNWQYVYIGKRYDDNDNEVYYRSCVLNIEPYSKVFGIGIYYDDTKEPQIISENEIAEIARLCDLQKQKEIAAVAKCQAETEAAIERGKKVFADAENKLGFKPQSVIIAEYRVNDSDIQSDYFASHAGRVVVLAFSKHNRDLFSEMRKAAEKSATPEIKALATAPENWENRERYTCGGGYYLGESRYSGVIIRKSNIGDDIYKAAGTPGCFEVPLDDVAKPGKKQQKSEVVNIGARVVDNAELSRIQVFFDDIPEKAIREELKKSGFFWSSLHKAWHGSRKEANRIKALQIVGGCK